MNSPSQSNLRGVLERAVAATGAQLKRSAVEVAAYTAQRAAHLAQIADQAGIAEATAAELEAVATFAGIRAVDEADAADHRILGILEGALAVAAGAAAG